QAARWRPTRTLRRGPTPECLHRPARRLRQIENCPWEGHTAPAPEQLLWSLCQPEEVELYWLAAPDEEGLGAVRLQDPTPLTTKGPSSAPSLPTRAILSGWSTAIGSPRWW